MQRRTLLLALIVLSLFATTACRSRRNVPPPATAPQPAPAVSQSTVVPSADRDFVAPVADDANVLSADIAEANRQARLRGWIRDAFFQFDAATLDQEAQAALTSSATWLRQNPQYRLRIEGHCDERGTEQYNLALGDRRAETAVAYLASLGIERGRIETVSLGEEQPFETGSSEAAWQQNRRAHLVLAARR